MKNLSIIALLLAAVLVPTSVQAGHDSPLTNAARAYRDAVVDFERNVIRARYIDCLLYTSPSPRDRQKSRMPSSA